jgi:hypothetical protein
MGNINSDGGGSSTSSNATAYGGVLRFHGTDYFVGSVLYEVANDGDGSGRSMVCVADGAVGLDYSPIVREVVGTGGNGYELISTDYYFYRPWLAKAESSDEMVCPLELSALHVMSASGVWRRVALPASCTANRRHPGNVAMGPDGLLYFTGYGPGGGYLLYQYDGTHVTAAHSISGTPPLFQPLALFAGSLWYANNTGGTVKLGRYDGETFEDDAFTFSGTNEIRQLVAMEDKLYALRLDTLEGSDDPSVAWSVIATESDAFDIAAVYVALQANL